MSHECEIVSARIRDWIRPLISGMGNHPKDRHVLAAAVRAAADAVVTDNVIDFPREAVSPFGVKVWTPDDFLNELYRQHPGRFLRIIRQQAAANRYPPNTVDDLLLALALHAPTAVARIRERLS